MNKLKYSSSPYLQQHADNPVHWQEWGDEALQRAKNENKPLLISIGYAACHWCHVMEHESFSDEEVATYMNENFVCIKVDREERPDVDRIYMDAVQLISGNGGWPLNAFALPNGKPFFAGTYYNRAQWMNVLSKISEMYKNENEKIIAYANQLTQGLSANPLSENLVTGDVEFDKKEYDRLFSKWESQIDFQNGGFNRAPKFPLPITWEFLLQYSYLTQNERALKAVVTTLDEMAKGGIYDQIGGGFARYSVDEYWKVPHFEKMLYDNAQLVSLYSHAFQITKNVRYKEIIDQTLEFVKRELTNDDGAFYSSLNADSEGEEGAYYVWTYDEFNEAVDDNIVKLASDYYQITERGNWEQEKNILLPKFGKNRFAKKHEISLEQFNSDLGKANLQLLNHREKRERPSTDDKVLTSWNALMIKAYIDAYRALGDEKYLQSAITSMRFIESNMLADDGSLWRNYMKRKASIVAFHDDYALLSQASMELYSVTFDKHWLDLSKQLIDYCIEHFMDKETGMFFYTSDISEKLITRKYELTDNVIPASNSIMANVLLKLGHYYNNEEYITMSKQMLSHVIKNVVESGPWYANWGILMGMLSYAPYEVAIMGNESVKMNLELQSHYLPTSLFLGGNTDNLPLLNGKLVKGSTLIYVCKNRTCKFPVSSISEALKQLN
ncbi:MAG: thioredoxin domain-containing protein [Bacteroidota bacterium]